MEIESEVAYRAVASRDRRFDGVFFTGVRSTGIYCRPSCPARTPRPENVTYHRTAASAQAAGYRACLRCLPDATPGSPAWDVAGDVAGRAMRLIADGVVDRDGVTGLAARLGYSPRHLGRVLEAELGAGPLALARAQRAQRARTLIESTSWRLADVAHAAGFTSIRQFNETVREVYGTTPSRLRSPGARVEEASGRGARVDLRIPVRTPFAGAALLRFLASRAVPQVEAVTEGPGGGTYLRSLRLPHGPGTVSIELRHVADVGGVHRVPCTLTLGDLRDLGAAVERCRRLLDADCDPVAVDAGLSGHPRLRGAVAALPGLRVPGHVDGAELALRAVLGQQVSVSAARRLAAALVRLAGASLPEPLAGGAVTRIFPRPEDVAALGADWFRGPAGRADAVQGLAAALAAGRVRLDRSADRVETRRALLSVPGVGPWTADVVAMRALGDPDVFLAGDAAVRRATRGGSSAELEEAWRPWRSYAVIHLWAESATPPPTTEKGPS